MREVQRLGALVRAVPLGVPTRTEVQLLDPSERSRADRFVSAADAADFLAGRIALRAFAAELAGVRPAALKADYRCDTCRVDSPDHGRPYYRRFDGAPGPLLSLSRAEGWAVMAGAESGGVLQGLGVDVEQSGRAAFPGFDALVLTSRERLAIRLGTSAVVHDQRTRLWVRKEAFLKATGAGLQRNPASVDVTGDQLEGVMLADLFPALLGMPEDLAVAVAATCIPFGAVSAPPQDRLSGGKFRTVEPGVQN